MVPLGNPKGKAIVYQLGLEKECYEKLKLMNLMILRVALMLYPLLRRR